MTKMGYEKGLVRYTTEHLLHHEKEHVIRPRIVVYGLILAAITVATGFGIAYRPMLELDIIRDRNSLFRETGMGMIENVYTLKLINKDPQAHDFEIDIEGVDGMKLNMPNPVISVASGDVVEAPVSIEVDPADLEKRTTHINFTMKALDNPELSITEEARFLGPYPGR
jgi:polyferredoxin